VTDSERPRKRARAKRKPAAQRPGNGPMQSPKLTAALAEEIYAAIRAGAIFADAAAHAGVAQSTFHEWLRKGRRDGARDPYRSFVVGLDRALADFKVGALSSIHGADEWQARAWMLERRFPDQFGRRTRVDASVQHRFQPVLDVSKLEPAELAELRRLLVKAAPSQDDLEGGQRPALELLPGEETT